MIQLEFPKILCTICARGGSKGVPGKNLRSLLGKPLIAHTVEQAIASGLFCRVIVSSDSKDIQDAAVQFGAESFFTRDAKLASDAAGKLQVIRDAFQKSEKYFEERYDFCCDLDCTSPLRFVEDIQDVFRLMQFEKRRIMITGTHARRSPYFNLVERKSDGGIGLCKKLKVPVLRRQDTPVCFDMNASIYFWNRQALLGCDTIFGSGTGIYVMPEERSIDVDSELDFRIVEMLMHERQAGGKS